MRTRLVSCLVVLALAGGASAELAGYWQLNEGAGATAADSSGNGNRGTLVGAPQWVAGFYGGALQFNAQSSYVEIPTSPSLEITGQVTVAAWVNWTDAGDTWLCILANGQQNGPWENYGLFVNRTSRFAYFTLSLNNAHVPQQTGNNTIASGQWQHLCGTWDGSTARIYVDGQLQFEQAKAGALTTPRLPLRLGHRNGSVHFYSGIMDEVAVFNHALTQPEIQKAMLGISPAELAADPSPEDTAADVHRDVALGWTPGRFAATHDVYFGTAFADVNDASRDDPKGVLAGQDRTAADFDPEGLLEYGRTYYWRIDEVNAAPDNTVFKGQTWSFTVEPFAYPLTGVTATASSAQPGMGPQNTVNGSGLNDQDQHSVEAPQMWMSSGKPAWIQFEFDKVRKLDHMLVWNSNQLIEDFLGLGAKTVTIECSADGTTWTPLEGVPEFARAPGKPTYAANTTVNFGGVMAKFVKLTISANWGGMAPQTGLSEVRFFYVPVQAFEPEPAVGAADVSVETALSWRPGREAASHKVYIGAEEAAVAAGSVPAGTAADHSYTPDAMNFGTKYFWKVDEVGEGGTYPGDVWSFTTQQYAAIDDFEAYTDDVDTQATIWHAWIDGLTTKASGSQVGYDIAPFAEQKIIHGGKQSMPLRYDNSVSPFYSEAERVFDSARNWTTNGADSLVVWFRGQAPGFVQTASGNIVMNAMGTDIWNNADEFRYAHKTLTGDGTMIARVESIAQSDVWAKGGVMIRQGLEPGSTHAIMAISPGGSSAGNGANFQHRLTAGGASTSSGSSATVVAAPYWVKIERKGAAFSGFMSPDGVTWTQVGTAQTIAMTGPVLIGLALCSHNTTVLTAAEFSNISTTGNVTGAWQVAEIGVAQPAGNSIEGLYLSVKDTSGKSTVVQSPDTAATANISWQQWKIPLSDFASAGVKMNAVKSIVIGVGNKAAPVKGGAGTLYIDDIGFGRPAQ